MSWQNGLSAEEAVRRPSRFGPNRPWMSAVAFALLLAELKVRRTGSAANRSDQEAATVDRQSLAGHEGLSH